MPKKGDYFIVSLTKSNLSWGTNRHTDSRDKIDGEAYISIPREKAVQFEIYNSNKGKEGIGYNEFNATSDDGLLKVTVKVAGSTKANDVYAKNLQTSGDLKKLGVWFNQINAAVGDRIEVHWISSTDIILTKI
ncbi:NgoFVII family restriction endonuclease [Liquorilactobacillus uvarum]|uniref:Restriction endonuclease type II NgoFVII C-terminal B3-like DNA-binding domain-containing protein n=1 Tax=Liquorilactobacillus uvarum DSM 19971 TaxID=1423812 RepID=A0A0R1PXB2_9LACO|nr:NgoFVII family restriction endonuclease [Liquorilactobacillus uvarum]KRL37232.1 hypothetical protein FD20_GL000570 [Liquorilactobacillus uvarum DSM 19971]